jgi:hypothetical protein
MLSVLLDPEVESLLRQTAADLDLTPEVAARILLESSLVMSLVDR